MVKSISKIATKIGDVKVIVKIDSVNEINEMTQARLNTVAVMVAKAFTPLYLRKNREKDNELKIYDFEK